MLRSPSRLELLQFGWSPKSDTRTINGQKEATYITQNIFGPDVDTGRLYFS